MNKDGVKVNNGTMLNFKMGAVAGLSSQTLTPGTVYVTTDERAMYVDLQNERIRLGDFNVYATLADLQAETHFSQTALYYVQNTGILYACVEVTDNSANLKPINDFNGLTEAVSQLQAAIATKAEQSALEGAVNTINGELAKKADKTALEALDTAYKAADTAIGTRIGAVESNVSALQTGIATKAEQADLEDAIEEIDGKLDLKADKTTVEALDKAYKAADTAIGTRIGTVEGNVSALQTGIATKAEQSALESAVNTINGELAKKATTEALNKAKSDLAAADTAIGERIDGIDDQITGINTAISTKAETSALTSAVNTINGELALKATKAELAADKEELQGNIDDVAEDLGETNATVSGHTTAIATINQDLAKKAAITYVDGKVSDLNTEIDKKADKTTVEALDAAYKAADKTINESISGLNTAVSGLESTKATITYVDGKVSDLNTAIDKKADKTTVAELDAAYKAADTAIGTRIGGVEGNVSSLQTAIATKAEVADVNALIGVNAQGKVSDGTTEAATVVQFVNDKFTAFNAMTFKGSVAKYENLPATTNAGDTYLLSANDAGYAAGDLFVANADGAASWTHVPSGYNQIHEQKLMGDAEHAQIQLYNATNTNLTTALTVATAGAVTATVTDGASPTLTIGMAWGTF